ncbi:MAG: sulfoxide reductase heme-binding subunit YedZ [Anaerolineae bacterium]|nr:sulfoxide reductase heme-binding subunit YedZ [Anaerolineae bacterium]
MFAFIKSRWISILAHVGALLPLAVLVYDYFADNLTANPIQAATIRTGKWALILLVTSLACTPINTVLGFKPALKVKRALGLYGFMFVCIHLLIFTVWDYGLDLALIWQQVIEKPFVLAGFGAFVLLVPLAITSTKASQKRLGKDWKSLHRVICLIMPIAILHFSLAVKSLLVRTEPLQWGLVVALLLLVRVPVVRKAVVNARGQLLQPRKAIASAGK